MLIRQAAPADAAQLLELRCRLDAETTFMMLEPGERTTTVADLERMLTAQAEGDHQLTLVAEDGGRLVATLGLDRGRPKRISHTGYIFIGVLQSHAGKGVGTALFAAMENWAREKGLHRLELTVMTHNAAGVALYRKMGFLVEGTRVHAMRVDGRYVDEYYMAKLL